MKLSVILLLLLVICATAAPRAQKEWSAKQQISADRELQEATYSVEVVHIIYMCHLDVGFIDFAHTVLQRYFNSFFPAAYQLSQDLRTRGGPEQFRWTTHPWLLHEYIKNGTEDQLTALFEAIKRDDITWHAGPFNLEVETMDQDLFDFSMELSTALDVQFGKEPKTVFSLKDVPGMTRGAVPVLAKRGVQLIHVGVNDETSPPAAPGKTPMGPVCSTFLWRDLPSGEEIIYANCQGYARGGWTPEMMIVVPGMTHALVMLMRPDNSGPQPMSELLLGWNNTRALFPNASIYMSTWENFTTQLVKHKDLLPVVTQEVGDTWVYGVASDPRKNRVFRELNRQRSAAILNGTVDPMDPRVFEFSRLLTKIPEHTWGLSNTVEGDYNWTNAEFDALRNSSTYLMNDASWYEQRNYLDRAVEALAGLPLQQTVANALEALEPAVPDVSSFEQISAANLAFTAFTCGDITLKLSSETGAIVSALNSESGLNWASATSPLALLSYQTFDYQQYYDFIYSYLLCPSECFDDFGKNNLTTAEATAGWYYPTVQAAWFNVSNSHSNKKSSLRSSYETCDIVVEVTLPSITQIQYGAPQQLYLQYQIQDHDVRVTAQWFNKRPTRLPEAVWFSVIPQLPQPSTGRWVVNKVGSWIDMADVVVNGTRWLHGTWAGCRYLSDDSSLSFFVETLDAPLVVPDNNTLLRFADAGPPNVDHGVHFNLFNNLWDTNYPVWTVDEDDMFRFIFHLDG